MSLEPACKGIFWIKSADENSGLVAKKIPVEAGGNIIDPEALNLNSKHRDNYNHKLTWETLDSKVTEGKPFDYYPRGRVEIKHGKAIIYANPNICKTEIINEIIEEFNLDELHGIKNVKVIPDYSEHYRCYLDRENGGK